MCVCVCVLGGGGDVCIYIFLSVFERGGVMDRYHTCLYVSKHACMYTDIHKQGVAMERGHASCDM